MRRIILAILLATVVPFSVGASYVSVARAQASNGAMAPHSTMVLVAVDVTSASACQLTYHLNISRHGIQPRAAPPPVPWTKTLSCSAGTILKTAVVPLSQALAQHERYAALPANSKAPTPAERAAVRSVLDAKHQSLAAAQSVATPIPTTGCGNDSYASLQWSASPLVGENVGFFSQVWWFRTSDCSTVYLDEGELVSGTYSNYGIYYPNEYWYWDADAYNTDYWGTAVIMPPNTSHYYYPSRTEPPQHWYRQYVSWNQGSSNIEHDTYVAVLN